MLSKSPVSIDYSLFVLALLEIGVILPYGIMPFEQRFRDVNDAVVSQDDWRFWHWNPPTGHHNILPDPNAGPKPTWKQVVAAAVEVSREQAIKRLRSLCKDCMLEAALDNKSQGMIRTRYKTLADKINKSDDLDYLTSLTFTPEDIEHGD